MKNKERMENINLIRKVAWSFHETTGLDWDDLFQEAALAYLEAMKTYDSRKGKVSTYAWNCIVSRLRNYLREEKKWQEPLCDLEEAYTRETGYYSFWHKIPEHIQRQVQIILEESSKIDSYFLDISPQRKEYKEELRLAKVSAKITIKQLLRKAGYDRDDITGAINTLEVIIRQF